MRTGFLTLALSAALVTLYAQEPAELPAFEVASIRPNTSEEASRILQPIQVLPGGRFVATGARLQDLIFYAYALQVYQTVEGDDALLDARFDVEARGAGDVPLAPRGQVGPLNRMVQTLLAERFNLRVRFEDREQGVYRLVRATEQLGPRLRPSACPQGGPQAADAPPLHCGRLLDANGELDGDGVTIARLVYHLQLFFDRPVLDRTGLDGLFDIDTRYNVRDVPRSRLPPGVSLASGHPSDTYPSIFTALKEDLGLELESAREPMPVLIVEHVELPTPN